MFADGERPTRVRLEQDRRLAVYLRNEVIPFSDAHRARLEAAGLSGAVVRGADDLAALTPLRLEEMGDPAELVLRPHSDDIRRGGDRSLTVRLLWAQLTGRLASFDATFIDPLYKPVHWVLDGGVPVGSSAEDVDRLGEIGRRWLESAGITTADALVSIVPPRPTTAFWQLTFGARRGGLPALHLDPSATAEEVLALAPTVLAGAPADLAVLLGSRRGSMTFAAVHTVLVLGAPLSEKGREKLLSYLSPKTAVLNAWCPPGVRSLWGECRGQTGLHTWPATELIQEVDGQLVWTSVGWRGTVFLRLATGVTGRVDRDRCPTCRRTSPRVIVAGPPPR